MEALPDGYQSVRLDQVTQSVWATILNTNTNYKVFSPTYLSGL
jgi:hypothetical protein